MQILNLAYPEKSGIKFTIHKFPDGQQNITIDEHDPCDHVQIRSRMNSFKDVELIVCANQALKKMGAEVVSLYVPYFLGARSDRAFSYSECHYLRDVICPIINSQGFYRVRVMDPHSNVLEACLNNFRAVSGLYDSFIAWAINSAGINFEYDTLVSPDAGSYKKVLRIKNRYQYRNMISFSKNRNYSGEIEVIAPEYEITNSRYIIIDDICDGGGTFIEIAKKIKEKDPKARIYLIVTHGIFSKSMSDLIEYFENIYTTDSVKNQYNFKTPGIGIHWTHAPFVRQLEVLK